MSLLINTSLFVSGGRVFHTLLNLTVIAMKNQKGQTAVEYALIGIVLLAIVATAVAQPLKDAMRTAFNTVKSKTNTINVTVS